MIKHQGRSTILLPFAVLALCALLVVVLGSFEVNRRLREGYRDRAFGLTRQLAFGATRSVAEDFWRFREEFTFSLTNLPYERLLNEQEAPPEALVRVRRFLSLNQNILRELVVIGPDGRGRVVRMTDQNYFTFTPLAPLPFPRSEGDMVVIPGLVQGADGAMRARVAAVIEPGLLWRKFILNFSLSHSDVWIHLLDQAGENLSVRHGGRTVASAPVFSNEVAMRLKQDMWDGYEGRLAHDTRLGDQRLKFISAYMPLNLEGWRGLLVISFNEQDVVGPAGKALGLLAAMAGALIVILSALFFVFTRHSLRDQREIEAAHRRTEGILNTVQSGILLVQERSGEIVETNAAALRLIGRSAGRVVGRRLDDFFLPLDGADAMFMLRDGNAEASLRDDTGRVLTVLANTVHIEFGAVRYLLCSFVDVTPLKEAADRLINSQKILRETNTRLQDAIHAAERLAREAETANRAKSTFLAMMSHELRTPLNSILGLSESLVERIHGPLTQNQERYLGLVVSSGHHLLDLINDILDLAKIESGRDELLLSPCSLLEVCQSCLRVVQPMATRRRQTFECVMPDPDVRVLADPRRLQQVLVNLIGNAVKFTPEGGSLGLRVSVADDIQLAVWDRGIGIAANQLSRVFDPFVQIDARLAREYGGTGLGLALVKQLVAAHGGRIEVKSELGRGSAFTVFLKRLAANEPDAPVASGRVEARLVGSPEYAFPGEPPLVLIADDIERNTIALREFLEAKGCRIIIAENGHDAVERAVSCRPDVVLMDIQMDAINGLEAIRLIRANPDQSVASVPIIALTGLAMPGDREGCLLAGADDYVSKPASPRVICALIARLITARLVVAPTVGEA